MSRRFRRTFDSVVEAFNYRITGGDDCPPDPVYGDCLRTVEFKWSKATFSTTTKELFEFRVYTPDAGVLVWICPDAEVAKRTSHGGDHIVYSLRSLVKVALAVEAGRQYDPGLLYDIELELDAKTNQLLNEASELTGKSRADLIMDALDDLRVLGKHEHIGKDTQAK
jgi:hypothetical protein